ncbi:MAG: hypothetical protein HYW89_02145 [Candidatus Sungiibacteriota bacterium]|uniref:Uncharacterized protein n=1 Tax=Candidatus Sungiibacteriota bacterium TaxID=2750080 RepID=A0A7T5RK93_9BACT|nr:MAG: hypothetical protein HYW89_02145 [Candidatus Sungbacteria bacterium]
MTAEKPDEEKLNKGLPDRQLPTQEQMQEAFNTEGRLIEKHREWIALVLDLVSKGEISPNGKVEIPIDPETETILKADLKDGNINTLAIHLMGKQVFYIDFRRLHQSLLKK